MEEEHVHTARQMLCDFAFTEWPDLTCQRTPSPKAHTSTTTLLTTLDANTITPFLLLSLARVLGAYCGTTDLLFARQSGTGARRALVRVSWTNEQTWGEVVLGIASQLQAGAEKYFLISELRQALGLRDTQFPCFAALSLEPSIDTASTSDFPLVIFYDGNTISLNSSSKSIHPSVSDQLLAQVGLLLDYALNNASSVLSVLPPFPSNLSSVYINASDQELSKIYPHLPRVEFATDYLCGRALSSPDAIAVRWFPDLLQNDPFASSESITYFEFDQKASQFARWLVDQGLQREDRVAVCLSRNLLFHIALMGIMRAGGCYVPIDPDLPEERKAYIARDSNATLVLTTTDLSPIELFGPLTVFVDDTKNQKAIGKKSCSSFNVATVDGLSYMLYTSGTTGNPKGCLLTHKGLAQALLALSSTAADVRMNDLSAGRYLAVASIAFDVHLGETFVPLALGIPLFSAPRSDLLENLPHYVNVLGITHLGIVPSLIEATLNASSDIDGKTKLRYIASGGEKMSDSILDKWADHPQVRLANFYGPSEVTIGCCARFMSISTPRANIGRPLGNVSAYIVDRDLNVLLRGSVGELVVEGALVGRGYHGRPDLTAKVFMEWPDASSWAYRTGDLVRMLPDSTLEILGRIDTQIKLRGVRIESEGISAIVRKANFQSSGASLDATTIIAKHPAIGSDQLVSFVTWDSAVAIAIRKSTRPMLGVPPKGLFHAIRTICNAELASYMRPSHIIPLSWLPLTSNGKTDAKILLEIFTQLSIQELTHLMTGDKADSMTACNTTEEAVFSILKERAPSYPGPSYPGLSIFECGLDSLGMIRFTSDLKSKFQKQLSAADIMQNPLLKDIARLVEAPSVTDQVLRNEDLVPPSAIQDVYSSYSINSVETVLPPFPIQPGVLARSAELDTLYVQHVILQCHENVSLPKVKEAWTTVVARHPILRTVFYIDQLILQVVLKPESVPALWREIKSGVTADRFVDAFGVEHATVIAQEINNSISAIPPLRITHFSLPTTSVVVLSIHHALYDGISLPLILSDVESAYAGSDLLPVASLQHILSRISLNDPDTARQFWVNYFDGFTISPSPFHGDLQDSSHTASTLISLDLTSPLSSVKYAATKQQVTLQALLTYVFSKLLATRLYHAPDVTFGVIRSGRLLPVENIDIAICPTISVLPMRVNFDKKESLLASIQEKISEMVDYEGVPLSRVQEWVRPGESLCEVLFSVSVRHNSTSSLWSPLNEEPPPADYPLAVEVVLDPERDALTIRAGFLEGYLTKEFISELLKDFEATLFDTEGLRNAHFTPRLADSFGNKSGSQIPPEIVKFDAHLDTSIDEDIHKITRDFLGVNESVLTNATSFISVGLDSIKAVGLAKRITKAGYQVNSSEVLKAATIQKLAQIIATKGSQTLLDSQVRHGNAFEAMLKQIRHSVDISRLKLSPNDDPMVYPATALQAGMISQTIASDGALYVNTFPIILPNGMDLDRLRSIWRIALDIFSTLRTSFHFIQEAGMWTQVVHSRCRLNWSAQEISNDQDFKAGQQKLLSSITLDDDTAFSRPPVWLRLFTPSSSSVLTSPRLVLVIHHALYDGLSISKLLHYLECLYHGEPLTAPVQFSALLPEIFHQEWEGTSFWTRRLHGFHPTPLSDQSSPANSPIYTSYKAVVLDPKKLSSLGNAEVTVRCLFQAGVAKLLSSLTKSDDIVFGHVVSGRGITGSEDVIGPMLNTIPCRVKLYAHISNLELLQQIHGSNVDVLPWQQASLRSIQKAMGVEQLWDCLFTFQPTASRVESIWSLESTDGYGIQIQYPLHIEVEQVADGFKLRAASRFNGLGGRSLLALIDELCDLLPIILESIGAPAPKEGSAKPACPARPIANIANTPAPPPLPLVLPPSLVTLETKREVAIFKSAPISQDSGAVISSTPNTSIPPALESILLALLSDTQVLTVDTPLASLGVDSITAIQIAGKCRLAGLLLRASDVINAFTVGDLVAKLKIPTQREAQVKVDVKPGNAISEEEYARIVARFGDDGRNIEKILPMSPGAKYILAGWQTSKGARWQTVFPFRLPGSIDSARLKNAWNLLLKRHEILRSTVASAPGSGEPRFVTFSIDFTRNQWFEETMPYDTFHQQLLSRLTQFVNNPLDIARPPLHAVLIRSQPSGHAYLAIHINHSQYDAWSLPLIVRDFSALYNILEPTSLGAIERFLGAFPVEGSHRSSQEKFWKSMLPSPFRPVLFPRLHSPRKITLPKFAKRICRSRGTAKLRASECDHRARLFGSSLNAVCLAVWASVHAKYAGTSSATFGIWHAGRSGFVEDVERLVVPCINVLPIHVSVSGSVLDAARYIRQNLLERTPEIEHSDLADIDRWTEAGGIPLFNAHVNILKVPNFSETDFLLEPVSGPYSIPEIAATTLTSTLDNIDYGRTHLNDLMVECAIVEKTDSLFFAIDSDGEWMDEEQTERVLSEYIAGVVKVFSEWIY